MINLSGLSIENLERIQKVLKVVLDELELPSSKLIIILENRDYMTMMKKKLAEIKEVYKSLQFTPSVFGLN